MQITIVNERELRELVPLDLDALEAVAAGFAALVTGEVALPPIMRIDVPDHNGEVDVKSAYVTGPSASPSRSRAGSGRNPRRYGIASSSSQMVVLSARTGYCEAILLDNGYPHRCPHGLGRRPGRASPGAAGAGDRGQVGAGAQGRFQMRALQLVRSYRRVLVYDRDEARLEAYVAEMACGPRGRGDQGQGPGGDRPPERPGHHQHSFARAVCAGRLGAPGAAPDRHGADAEHKQELFPEVLARADLIVCDRRSQCAQLGELQHALAAGLVTRTRPSLTSGSSSPGATRPPVDRQFTVADLTGVGVQDTAISLLAYERAVARGVGTSIDPRGTA